MGNSLKKENSESIFSFILLLNMYIIVNMITVNIFKEKYRTSKPKRKSVSLNS